MSREFPKMNTEQQAEEKRARGEGLRDEEREAYNKARAEREKEEFIRGEGPAERAIERESKERSEKRKEAEAVLQHRLQMVEGFIESHNAQIESLAKEIDSLNERWSANPERRGEYSIAIKTKESIKYPSEKEREELLKERDNILLEIQKLEY